MEVFGARPEEPMRACLSEIEAADLFVGLYAHRYGFIAPGRRLSITEEEFDHARHLGKPIFGFVVHDDHPWPPRLVDVEPAKSQLVELKLKLNNLITRDVFTTPEDLAVRVATSVGRYLAKGRRDELTARVKQSLGQAGLDTNGLAGGRALADVPAQTRAQVERLLDDLRDAVLQLASELPRQIADENPEAMLALAQGLMAERRWLEAARAFEDYAKRCPEDWEASYLRGVAFANSRQGRETDTEAMRAYNDAIAFAPTSIDPNLRARLSAYRGALFKRLGRLDEAHADLIFAKDRATAGYEVDDIAYNLACVYAMGGKRDKLMAVLAELRHSPSALGAIYSHLDDYFQAYANDPDFRRAIGH